MAGCASQSSVKPVEALDERTGATVGALKEPIELIASTNPVLLPGRRASFAYLGPVEWNQSGVISYGLWVDIAPGGSEQRPADIHVPGTLTLILDDGPLSLTPMEAPKLGHAPYQQAASWGQADYFELDVKVLKRMAQSQKLQLEVRTVDGSSISFSSTADTRAALTHYMEARGITGD